MCFVVCVSFLNSFLSGFRLLLRDAMNVSAAVSDLCRHHSLNHIVRAKRFLNLLHCQRIVLVTVLRKDDRAVYDQEIQVRCDRDFAFLTRNCSLRIINRGGIF